MIKCSIYDIIVVAKSVKMHYNRWSILRFPFDKKVILDTTVA